ncbi:hypothetical protein Leryth_009519 [Lithospermum erythrorhizon]|nr:hypothetical protein Leryth_009519 [Lithospermum erythrorhizon]
MDRNIPFFVCKSRFVRHGFRTSDDSESSLGGVTSDNAQLTLVRCRRRARSKSTLIRCVPLEQNSFQEYDAKTLNNLNPWKRRIVEDYTNTLVMRMSFWNQPREPFDFHERNKDLDIYTQRAALKVSPSVVSLISYSGGKRVFFGSGVIFGCIWEKDSFCCSVLTSNTLLKPPTPHHCCIGIMCDYDGCNGANLSHSVVNDVGHLLIDGKIDVYLKGGRLCEGVVVASDPHYNIAVLSFKSDIPLPCAVLRPLDYLPANSNNEARCFSYPPLKLIPGDGVIAVARDVVEPFQIMAAPGKYRAGSFWENNELDCTELFRADCKITKSGIGGPLISRTGEVIGINFYSTFSTPFLPINVFLKWWSYHRVTGSYCRPSLGMQVANLDTARGEILEHTRELGISQGLVVEKILSGSPAETSGVHPGDVIIKCSNTMVVSSLELFEIIWDLAGKVVEVVVVRDGSYKSMQIEVKDITSEDELYQWPLPRCGTGYS